MNRKKIMIVLIIFILLIFVVYFFQKNVDENKKNNNELESSIKTIGKYNCMLNGEWIKFDVKDINGNELGNYKKSYSFSFTLLDNKSMSDINYIISLEFDSIDGYSYKGLQGEFTESFDQEKLIKKFTSNSLIPVEFTNDDTSDTYVDKLSNLGYICSKVD